MIIIFCLIYFLKVFIFLALIYLFIFGHVACGILVWALGSESPES